MLAEAIELLWGGPVSLDEQTTVAAFLQPTLVCAASARLADVFAQLSRQSQQQSESVKAEATAAVPPHHNQIVLVDQHQHPLGLIHLSQLLGDVLLAPPTPPDYIDPLRCSRSLSELAAAYLEPLLSVPAHVTVPQFWQQLQSIPPTATPHCAIIAKTTGAFLGLVDLPKLMHYLAHESTLSPTMPWLAETKSQLDASLGSQPDAMATATAGPGSAQPLTAKIANLTVANQLNATLLAEISHDLKNPLTAIVGLSHVLKNPGLGALSDRQRQYVELIGQKSQQLMQLMSDLLDFTQLQTYPLPLQSEQVAILTLCKQAIAQATQSHPLGQALAHEQPIQLNLAPDLPALVADELRLRQLLVALLRNGLGLAGAQGNVGLQVEQWGDWITFTIWDTGWGIPLHQQHLVCLIPQTLDHPERDQLYVMGLGVILAQRLAQLQGGDLTFVSAPEQGSQFTLLLPLQRPETGEQDQRLSPLSHRLILVVATAPDLITTLTQHIRNRGDQVVIARSGPEALEKNRILQPQAILLHLILPLVSGWDVLTLLRHTPDTPVGPIIAIGEAHQRQPALQGGAQDLLTQPILRQDLNRCLDQIASGGDSAPNDREFLASSGLTKPPQQPPTNRGRSLPSWSAQAPDPDLVNLTILHLEDPLDPEDLSASVSQHLHVHGCRVIATGDLEEAELLAQIWGPQSSPLRGS